MIILKPFQRLQLTCCFIYSALLISIILIKKSHAMNSYIYLPDKYIQEELAIGSLIVDLADELNTYYTKPSNNNNNNNQKPLKSGKEFKQFISNQQYTFLEDVKLSNDSFNAHNNNNANTKNKNANNNYFLLDLVTGRITSKRYIDRESMCLNRHCSELCESSSAQPTISINTLRCKMNLKILLIPSYNIISLNILIEDINDNKPQFLLGNVFEKIPENVPIGYKIPIALAYDPDSGLNGIQYYKLIFDPQMNTTQKNTIKDTFELVQNLNELQLALVVKKSLDREIQSEYNLKIGAYDGGQPSFSGQLEMHIEITDINDNSPKFDKNLYSISLREDTPVETELPLEIRAIDADEDLNGLVKYSLVENGENSASRASDFFELDSDTGVLKLIHELDYEIDQYFTIIIEARDCGIGSVPSYAHVEITIIDCNDNKPEISVSFLNTLYRNSSGSVDNVYLYENIQANKYIAHVSIFDKDSNENGYIDWSVFVNGRLMKNQDYLVINKLNNNSFTILTGLQSAKLYDRELFDAFNVSILTWDFGAERQNMEYYNFTVNLLDENDNRPKFDEEVYNFFMKENNEENALVGVVRATDADAGLNAQLNYSIQETSMEHTFSVDEFGNIRALRRLDREKTSLHQFHVVATDMGGDKEVPAAKMTSVLVKVNVMDLNDNDPIIVFNSSYLSKEQLPSRNTVILNVDENLPINAVVMTLSAIDKDEGSNAMAKFQMVNERAMRKIEQPVFGLVYENGKFVIKVTGALDREEHDSFEFKITCADSGEPARSASINLLIYVNDKNDNCPRNNALLKLNNAQAKYLSKFVYVNKDLYLKAVYESVNRDLEKIAANFTPNDESTPFSFPLMQINYTDADAGKNAELQVDLLSNNELFTVFKNSVKIGSVQSSVQVSIEVRLSKVLNELYRNKLINFTQKAQMAVAQFRSALNLGKYLLKIRVSDYGEPRCVLTEYFYVVVGNDELDNKNDVLAQLRLPASERIKPEWVMHNDRDYDESELEKSGNMFEGDEFSDEVLDSTGPSKISKSAITANKLKMLQKTGAAGISVASGNTLTKSDYMLIVILISIVILIAILFSLIATVYFYSKFNGKGKRQSDDSILKEPLRVSPIGHMHADSSPLAKTKDNCEILYNDNRYSLSNKSILLSASDHCSNSLDSENSSLSGNTKETKSFNLSYNSSQMGAKASCDFKTFSIPNSSASSVKNNNSQMVKKSRNQFGTIVANSNSTASRNMHRYFSDAINSDHEESALFIAPATAYEFKSSAV